MRSSVTVLVLTCVLLLAGCGAPPTPPPPPPPPSALDVQPTVAAVGDTIVITGSDLASAGTLTVGGVETLISSWSEARVEAVVAPGTPAGPQAVVLTADSGTANAPELFVGVAYDGTAADLQAFLDGLRPGDAVRLPAATYTLTADLTIDNHGLYGQGIGQTALDSATFAIQLLVDSGHDVTIADMSIATDAFFVDAGGVEPLASRQTALGAATDRFATRTVEIDLGGSAVWTLPTVDALAGATDERWLPADLRGTGAAAPTGLDARTLRFNVPSVLWDAAAPARAEPIGVAAAALVLPLVELRNLAISENAGGVFGVPSSGRTLPAVAMTVDGVTYDGPESGFAAIGMGPITVVDSTITANLMTVYSGGDVVDVNASTLAGVITAGGARPAMAVASEGGTSLVDSTLTGESATILVVGSLVTLGTPLLGVGAPVTITGSRLLATDADLTDGVDEGVVTVTTQLAPILIASGSEIAGDAGVTVQIADDRNGIANVTVEGSTVRAGVSAADVTAPDRPIAGDVEFVTIATSPMISGPTIRFENNDVTATRLIEVAGMTGNPQALSVRNNTFRAGDGNDDGIVILTASSSTTTIIEGNTIDADGQVQAAVISAGSSTVVDNTIRIQGDVTPDVSLSFDGSCKVEGNQISVTDTGADDSAGMVLQCAATVPADTLVVDSNTFTLAGDGRSTAIFVLRDGAVSMTGNTVAVEAGVNLGVDGSVGSVAANTFAGGAAGLDLRGDAATVLTLSANTVDVEATVGLGLVVDDVGSLTADTNVFTNGGVPTPDLLAVAVLALSNPVSVVLTGNRFENFGSALYFGDVAGAALGIDAEVHGNVFDFVIDAAPKAAELGNVKDAIDATGNVWGTNTAAATVAGYVTLSGDTTTQGGSIDVDPLTIP